MKKVLLVDDDRNFTHLTKIALVKGGYEVAIVNESSLVIQEVKEHKPDLILMDIMMPRLNGGDLVRLFRKDPELKDIPVIFLTALISEDEEMKIKEVNIEGVSYQSLGKHYEIEYLLKVMEDSLS